MTDKVYNKVSANIHGAIWNRVWEQLEAQVNTHVIGTVRDLLRMKIMRGVRDDVCHQIEDLLEGDSRD